MTSSVLTRLPEQRMAALEAANQVRFARARLKVDLRAGDVDAAEVLADPPAYLSSMKVEKFLASIPGIGVVKARWLMRVAQISEAKTVGGMSPRQRRELVKALVERRRS